MPASLTYNSCWDDTVRGNINFATDTFKAIPVTSGYTPDKDTHTKRSQVTSEVVGTGYTAGGIAVAATIVKDLTNDRIDITFANPSWAAATFTARGMVIYKSRGGASSADELVGYVDFGADITSTSGAWAATFSTPLRIQN